MTVAEFRVRLNRCNEVYNRAMTQDLAAASHRRMMQRLIDRIGAIARR